MATKEEIQQLLDAIKGALSAKFDENDKMFTTLINGLQTQFSAQESRFSTLEQQQMVNPAVSCTHAQIVPSTVPISENRERSERRSRGFQLSLEKYDGKQQKQRNNKRIPGLLRLKRNVPFSTSPTMKLDDGLRFTLKETL